MFYSPFALLLMLLLCTFNPHLFVVDALIFAVVVFGCFIHYWFVVDVVVCSTHLLVVDVFNQYFQYSCFCLCWDPLTCLYCCWCCCVLDQPGCCCCVQPFILNHLFLLNHHFLRLSQIDFVVILIIYQQYFCFYSLSYIEMKISRSFKPSRGK